MLFLEPSVLSLMTTHRGDTKKYHFALFFPQVKDHTRPKGYPHQWPDYSFGQLSEGLIREEKPGHDGRVAWGGEESRWMGWKVSQDRATNTTRLRMFAHVRSESIFCILD